MNRRNFLKMAGLGSVAFAAGCSPEADKRLHTLVRAPDDMVPGQATWYASTCRQCPSGCGLLAKNREGRLIKLEGNPLHPINQGALCQRGQAVLQGLYHPDRLPRPMLRSASGWQTIDFDQAAALVRRRAHDAVRAGGGRIALVTECVGDSLLSLMVRIMADLGGAPPLVYEPFALDDLKAANHQIFGIDGLVGYRLETADLLVSLGADFLDTWLSPVEYARRFKSGHAFCAGHKAVFVHVAPCQTVTGANADRWIACRPGGQAAIALGLLRERLAAVSDTDLPPPVRLIIEPIVSPWTAERVAAAAGIPQDDVTWLHKRLAAARKPLVLGAGAGAPGGLQTHMAVNLLNRILDPQMIRLDLARRHRLETAVGGSRLARHLRDLSDTAAALVLLNNVDPVYSLPGGGDLIGRLQRRGAFVVSFGSLNTDTAAAADMVFPVALPLETWDEYAGHRGLISMLQPAVGRLGDAPALGDVLLDIAYGPRRPVADYRRWMAAKIAERAGIRSAPQWDEMLQQGGIFGPPAPSGPLIDLDTAAAALARMPSAPEPPAGPVVVAAPSIRFFDGRSADHPWLLEVPEPLSQVTWQTAVAVHPETAARLGLRHGAEAVIEAGAGRVTAPVFVTASSAPETLAIGTGQGHLAGGRYARGRGPNVFQLLDLDKTDRHLPLAFANGPVRVRPTGRRLTLAHTDGSSDAQGRKIALSVALERLAAPPLPEKPGLTMNDFPLTLPLPEGYDPKRDVYPPHDHAGYRWGMVVDLDRCTGCGACAVACYAENNVAVVGEGRIAEGREMAWLRVERYIAPDDATRVHFLPMMCQHCDNAPCESVCPVYAPHHGKEGLNNQVYNRCIGTRFCAQNCPYKVRRFNWFDYRWPPPLDLQLNPDVTVRAKGVMEKCSFCVQRIKAAHNVAKNEGRRIRDGEITPACAQTCPTGAMVFGDLSDPASRARKLCADRRAYQVMGYLNTKPAVIYLKKVVVSI